MGQISLAEKISSYSCDLARIESPPFANGCKRFLPLKGQCYENEELTKQYLETDTLACASIKDSNVDVIKCLMPKRNQWYKMGIIMGLSKADLDTILVKRKDPSIALMEMINILIERHSLCTWRRVIDALHDMNFNVIADDLESLGLEKCRASGFMLLEHREYRKWDFTPEKKRTTEEDFDSKEEIQRHTKKIIQILHIPILHVSDEDVLSNLNSYIAMAKLSQSEREIIMTSVEKISDISSTQPWKVAEHTEELESAIRVTSDSKKDKNLMRADYDMFSDELSMCHKILNTCTCQLKSCSGIMQNSGDSVNPGVQRSINRAFGKIKSTRDLISELQKSVRGAGSQPRQNSGSDSGQSFDFNSSFSDSSQSFDFSSSFSDSGQTSSSPVQS